MVAGGQGAPLVPLLDYALFRHPKRGRILQNLGGIANMTAIPPGAAPEQVAAFDSGPANMVVDWLMEELYGKPFDRDGEVAATGNVLKSLLDKALGHKFFRKAPPKSAGREQFGREFSAQFLADCRGISKRKQDAIATATALTAHSIARAYGSFVADSMGVAPVDCIVSGGGARNATLMAQLAEALKPYRCRVAQIDEFGMPAEAKEAAAFALLAYQTWHRRAGNVPSATGATRPAILGQVTYV
jgi:anhydro-N-acetylmuramic acid kinase